MTRGNQRNKDRERNEKEMAKKRNANNLSGSEFQRKKESDAEKMRIKQAQADARKAADGAAGGGKKK
ncbi:hypothetical protein P175DRAFT_0445255 [Aspergillus ochraceoroseus IBT 24754]|uniref:Small EDRK-rich factor-like N-terminal domain-containing protein n=1 Tax=Aspergillus ochraceoroseus IBT 24754 TaxID=1392256 RepID=A0A2T5LMX3_9EURO|nr:uncharacterized protein P175DRAFT_0445255 [Aspergillus ochraceoroseus IBT 24754]PTU17635.1 hypothetical protein P175DRAFT_0445255 [Aspergillus ochraceoroseus IBT 24754]